MWLCYGYILIIKELHMHFNIGFLLYLECLDPLMCFTWSVRVYALSWHLQRRVGFFQKAIWRDVYGSRKQSLLWWLQWKAAFRWSRGFGMYFVIHCIQKSGQTWMCKLCLPTLGKTMLDYSFYLANNYLAAILYILQGKKKQQHIVCSYSFYKVKYH